MPNRFALRVNNKIPIPQLLWRDRTSSLFLASPIVAIAVDTNAIGAHSYTGMTLGSIYILATTAPKLRQFLAPELALVLFYPAPSTALLATFLLFLRLWKDIQLMRTNDSRGRTNLLLDLGFQPTTKVGGHHGWLVAAASLAWFIDITNHTGWLIGWTWIPFLLFATRLVSVLTSPSVIEESQHQTSENRHIL
jgi:hypothetical protein